MRYNLTLLILTISLLLSGCMGNNEGNVTISERPTIQEENIEKNWHKLEFTPQASKMRKRIRVRSGARIAKIGTKETAVSLPGSCTATQCR